MVTVSLRVAHIAVSLAYCNGGTSHLILLLLSIWDGVLKNYETKNQKFVEY